MGDKRDEGMNKIRKNVKTIEREIKKCSDCTWIFCEYCVTTTICLMVFVGVILFVMYSLSKMVGGNNT